MEGLIMAAQLLLGLSILVILHEAGHFFAARAFGIKVEKFYLFFDAWGFKLFHFTYKGCEYGIGWLPLGGYVKIAGMIDESMDKEQMAEEPKDYEFRSKPAWQRLIVMLGGIFVNVVLGIIIFWFMRYGYGENRLPVSEMKYGVVASDIAKNIGIQNGDVITHINGEEVKYYNELIGTEILLGEAVLTVNRNGETLEFLVPTDILEQFTDNKEPFVTVRTPFTVGQITPGGNAADAGIERGDKFIAVNGKPVNFFDEFADILLENGGDSVKVTIVRPDTIEKMVLVTDDGKIGFQYVQDTFNFETIKYSLFEALPRGADMAFESLTANVRGLGKVVTGKVSARKSLQGPIGIATMYGGEWDWFRFWNLTGMLSMILAFMNLLPIPALDGGHVVFLLAEMVMGRPLSDKFLERAQVTGFIILLVLMAFIFGNDIVNLFR